MIIHLLILQVVTFVVLLIVLRQLFYKQLNAALARLQSLHRENLARERDLKLEEEAASATRGEMLKRAQDEAAKIKREATVMAEKITGDVERKALERAEGIIGRSLADLDRKARDLVAQQHQHAVELAVKMVKLAFSPKGQEILHDNLLEELIAEIGRLDDEMFKASSRENVQVVAAFPINDQRKADLVRILSEKIGSPMEIDIRQDVEIIAGLVVNIGSLTLDGSLRNKLEKASSHLKK